MNMATVAELRALAEPHAEHIVSLEAKLDDYWSAYDPLFDWTPAETSFRSAGFLRRAAGPRRGGGLALVPARGDRRKARLAGQRAQAARRSATSRPAPPRL